MAVCGLGLNAAEPESILKIQPDGSFTPSSREFVVGIRFPDARVKMDGSVRSLALPGRLNAAVEWETPQHVSAQLDLCQVRHAVGLTDVVLIAGRVRFSNLTKQPQTTTLAVAITPSTGANRPLPALAFERHAFFIEGRPALVSDTPSRGAILAESAFATRPLAPQDTAHVESTEGQCRGEMLFDVVLKPGESQTLGWICSGNGTITLDECRLLSVEDLFAQAEKETAGH